MSVGRLNQTEYPGYWKLLKLPLNALALHRCIITVEAGIGYVGDSGRVFDFHALRGQCESLLAARGAHPKLTPTAYSGYNLSATVGNQRDNIKENSNEDNCLDNGNLDSKRDDLSLCQTFRLFHFTDGGSFC